MHSTPLQRGGQLALQRPSLAQSRRRERRSGARRRLRSPVRRQPSLRPGLRSRPLPSGSRPPPPSKSALTAICTVSALHTQAQDPRYSVLPCSDTRGAEPGMRTGARPCRRRQGSGRPAAVQKRNARAQPSTHRSC